MYWKTEPTTYRVGETTKPDSGSGIGSNASETKRLGGYYPRRTDDAKPEGDHLDEAEATAREYCRRKNMGKWGLRKV